MKIVIAPDSFKGTMSAKTAANIIKDAFLCEHQGFDIKLMPMSDGGEGITDVFFAQNKCEKITKFAKGPNGDIVRAVYLLSGDVAMIEMAQASGIMLTPKKKDPMHASSAGTGEMIRDAVKNGAKTIILGIGGSATIDGGAGMAKELGFVFKDGDGKEITPDPQGLLEICSIDDSGVLKELKDIRFVIASDVKNTLLGKYGAANVFGKQKGAGKNEIALCERALERFSALLEEKYKKPLASLEGSGAAGGIILSLVACFDTTVISGADMVLDIYDFDKEIKDADLVITGEGRMDSQSLAGKVPVAVAKRAQKAGVPTIVIAGDACKMTDELKQSGITAVFSTNRKVRPFDKIKENCKSDLFETARAIAAALKIK